MAEQMTKQQVFDKVARHLIMQGCRSTNGDGECVYRSPDSNLKCAAGVLIGDEQYAPKMEGYDVSADFVREAVLASGVPAGAMELVKHMQDCHDSQEPYEWASELRDIAKRSGVSPAIIDQALQEREHASP